MKERKPTFWIATANQGKAKEFKLLLKEHQLYFLKDLKNYKSPEETGQSFKENAQIKARTLKNHLKTGKILNHEPENAQIKARTLKNHLKTSKVMNHEKEATSCKEVMSHEKEATSCKEVMNRKPAKQQMSYESGTLQKQSTVDYWVLGEDSGLSVPALQNAPGIYSARYAGAQATDEENLQLLLKNMKAFFGTERTAFFVSYIVVLSPTGKEYYFEGRIEGAIAHAPKGQGGFGYDPVFVPKGESLSLSQLGMEYKNCFSHRARAVEKMKQRLFI